MANQFQIPKDVEVRLMARFKNCAYCGKKMRAHIGIIGVPRDKATIEHLNRKGPFYWSSGKLLGQDLVMCCGQCNSSRGRKKLLDWFQSPYCLERSINTRTVAKEVKKYLRTKVSKK